MSEAKVLSNPVAFEVFSPDRMFTYLKGYVNGANLPNAQAALVFARRMHKDQTRKAGHRPYIIHPLTMACHAVALGLRQSDAVIAACLLHDVVEDCGVLPRDLPVDPDVQNIVALLTHDKADSLDVYYGRILHNKVACLVKLLDRCDNVSTMSGVFTEKKLLSYINETRRYAPELYRTVKENWPELSDAMFVLKYHITSVINSLDAAVQVYSKEELS